MVTEAKSKLTDASKSITPGRIVAELNLGFWTSLFNAYYEQKGASDPRLWPRLLLAVVPRMPRRQRTRRNLVRYLNDIRALRNRVFHHEPIWNLPASCRGTRKSWISSAGSIRYVVRCSGSLLDSRIHTATGSSIAGSVWTTSSAHRR
jgi:hypothetical protein